MRKLIKKSLACCLALALLLSAAVTSLATVSETAQAAVEVSSFTVNAEKTTATAVVDITSTDGIAAIFLNATSDFGALTAVDLTNAGNTFEEVDGTKHENADGFQAIVAGEDYDLEKGNIILLGQSTSVAVKSATITLTFTAAEAVADGSYTVTVAPAADLATADWNEVAATFATASATVEVATEPEVPEEPEPEFISSANDFGGGATNGYSITTNFNYELKNATVKEYGVLCYRAAIWPSIDEISIENASLSGKATMTGKVGKASLGGFTFSAIVEKFVFAPYALDTDGNYYYGDPVEFSYVDYLRTRITDEYATAAIGKKAKAILNAYYKVYGEAYEGHTYTGPENFVDAGTYAARNPYAKAADGEFATTPRLTGATTYNKLNIYADFSQYTGPTAAEYGIVLVRAAAFEKGTPVTIETAALTTTYSNPAGAVPLEKYSSITERFAIAFYVKDVNGDYHYSDVWRVSYTDYLVDKLNGSNAATALKAQLMLDADNLVYGRNTSNSSYYVVG